MSHTVTKHTAQNRSLPLGCGIRIQLRATQGNARGTQVRWRLCAQGACCDRRGRPPEWLQRPEGSPRPLHGAAGCITDPPGRQAREGACAQGTGRTKGDTRTPGVHTPMGHLAEGALRSQGAHWRAWRMPRAPRFGPKSRPFHVGPSNK